MTSKGQGQTLKILKSNISKTVRDRENVSYKLDRKSCMGFRMVRIFLTSGDSKGQGQILKYLKSNISKTVRNREKVSIEVS